MKKTFSVVTGALSGVFLLAFVVVCIVNYAPYIHSANSAPFDLMIAVYAMVLLVPSVVLGTAALVREGKVKPLYIAAGVLALMTIPAWVNIAVMDFILGLPLLICISCVLCGALITTYRTKPLFICAGAFLAAFSIIAVIAAAPWRGNDLLSVLAVYAIPALDSVSFGPAGGFYLLGKSAALFVLGALLVSVAGVLPFIWGALGFVFGVPTILCAAVCVALGILSKRERKA